MTITEFILARVAEDEAVALHGDGGILDMEDAWFSTSRVLAECEAKRWIVEAHPREGSDLITGWQECRTCFSHTERDAYERGGEQVMEHWPCPTLRALAAIWADHPDYQPEWKP